MEIAYKSSLLGHYSKLWIEVDGFGTHPATTSHSIFNMKISTTVGIPLLLGRFGYCIFHCHLGCRGTSKNQCNDVECAQECGHCQVTCTDGRMKFQCSKTAFR